MTGWIHPLSQTWIPFAAFDLVCGRVLDEFLTLDRHAKPSNRIMFPRSRFETQFKHGLSYELSRVFARSSSEREVFIE